MPDSSLLSTAAHALPADIASGRTSGRTSGRATNALTPPVCVVLDSNVWVDIVVFDDIHARPIRDALVAQQLDAVISPSCREELRRVLGYPQFTRFAVDIEKTLAWVDAVTRLFDPALGLTTAARLPRCRDTDDQKFLELAQIAQARYLVSKDKAVLKLRRRMAQVAGVTVVTPMDFVAHLDTQHDPIPSPKRG